MKKMLFVFNQYAGKGLIRSRFLDLVNIFTEAGYMVTAYPTQKARDGYEKVRAADGVYDMIVCCGGDGTLNEVIAAVMTYRSALPQIGYIPAGTTNDFAKSLGIPVDMRKAAKLIAEGNAITCDLGKFNGRFFNYVAAFGIFTESSYRTPQNMKNVLGHQAYVLEAMKDLKQIKSYEMSVSNDDIRMQGKYIYGMVSNSRSIGGLKGITGKDVVMDDGFFEVVLIKEPQNAIDLQQIVAGLFSKNTDTPMVDRFKTSRITFTSKEPVGWTIDGEDGHEHRKAEITVVPKAIKVIAAPVKEKAPRREKS